MSIRQERHRHRGQEHRKGRWSEPLLGTWLSVSILLLASGTSCSKAHHVDPTQRAGQREALATIAREMACRAYAAATAAGYNVAEYVVVAISQGHEGWFMHFERKEPLERLGSNDFGVQVGLDGKTRVHHGR